MLCDIQDRRGLRGLPRQRPLTTPSAVLLERSARSGGTRAPPLVRLPPSTGDLRVPCLPTHCSDSCPVSRAPAAETRATRPHILRDWLRLEGRKDPVPDGVLGVLRTALGPGWARAPHGPAFPSRSHEGTHQPLERVLQGHLGSWPPLLGMGRREWLVFRRQLCPLTFSSPCPRAPDLRRAGSAYSGTSAVALSSPEGRGGPSHLTERLRHLHARLASWGWRRDSHMGFPSLIPFRRARGGTRDMSVTRPSPFVTGLRSAAGGWLSCQHPKHRARDAGSLGPLPSAVTARDAGGGGPQTAGR